MIFPTPPDIAAGFRTGLSALLLVCFVASPIHAQERERAAAATPDADAADDRTSDAEPIFPWVGEELYYSVRVSDAEAMRGGVRAGNIERHGNSLYVPINGTAQSRGFLDAAYPIDDRANTFLDPESLVPYRTEKQFNENGKFRSYDVDYRHNRFAAEVERHREDRQSNFESPIPDSTHDMLTWVYDYRQNDLSLGDKHQYFIYDGWLLSRIHLEVVEREELLTPIGWFNTWKVKFQREILDPEENTNSDGEEVGPPELSTKEQARHTGHIWFSRDENHIPVRLTIDTAFGAGNAVLIHYQPGEPR